MIAEPRIIETAQITQAVAALCVEANTCLGTDIYTALCLAKERETLPLAVSALATIVENAEIAQKEQLPICQDTGMAVVFAEIGSQIHINGNITEAINEGVRTGYRKGYCRNSIVQDPIERKNTGDNTPAVIHYDMIDGDKLTITVAPKGFGSENKGRIRMLNPSDGLCGVEDFVVETVRLAGASACPPMIVGVGIGATMEKAALLSKQALLRDVGSRHPDSFWATVESNVLARINALGIGPLGYGGDTTALDVHILTHPTHIAGLPVAVSIGCHATRHKRVVL